MSAKEFKRNLVEQWRVKHSTFYLATQGDKEAVAKVVQEFTRMVHMWAHKYNCPQSMYEDMVQDGIGGILEAISTFSFDKTAKSGKPISPSTWVWWKTRAAVKRSFEKNHRLYEHCQSDRVEEAIDSQSYYCEVEEQVTDFPSVEDLLVEGCGSLDSRRAQVVKDVFGLLGNEKMERIEVAKKYGITKQATCKHITKFFTKIREKHPNLKNRLS